MPTISPSLPAAHGWAVAILDDVFISAETLHHAVLDASACRRPRDGHPGYQPHVEYHVSSDQSTDHEYGSGGLVETRVRLLKGDVPVVESVLAHSYQTSFDDSCDYGQGTIKTTFLLADDPVARAVIEDAVRGPALGNGPRSRR